MATFRSANRGSAKWRDPSFPAAASSLYWRRFLRGSRLRKMAKKVRQVKMWKRPSQIKSKPLLYGKLGKPVPNGINQEAIGDCWFLAAAAALAEVPARITDVIHNRDYDKNGIFRFKFWQKG